MNVAVRDRQLAATIDGDFKQDLENSHRITYEQWASRSIVEKCLILLRLFDRQF